MGTCAGHTLRRNGEKQQGENKISQFILTCVKNHHLKQKFEYFKVYLKKKRRNLLEYGMLEDLSQLLAHCLTER